MQQIAWKAINKKKNDLVGVFLEFSVGLKRFGMRRYKEDRNNFCVGWKSSGL